MRRFLGIILAIVLVTVLILSGCAAPIPPPATTPSATQPATTTSPTQITPATTPSPTGAKPIVLKFAYDPPPTGAVVAGWNWFGSEIEKRSNGRVKIEFYPGGALFAQAQALDSVKAGVADMTNVSLQEHIRSFPVTNVLTLPALGFSDTTKEGYEDAYSTFKQLYEKYPQIKDEYKDVHILFWHVMPAYRIVSKNKIAIPDDLKGQKIGGGGVYQDIVKLAGGVPVQVHPPISYESLEKGVVSGVYVAWLHVRVYKLAEVATYYLDYDGFGQNVLQVLMNKKTWDSLPADIQKLIVDLTPEAMARSTDSYINQSKGGMQDAQAKNRTIITPTADQIKLWDALSAPVAAQWIKDVQAVGITNGQDILNTLTTLRAQAMK